MTLSETLASERAQLEDVLAQLAGLTAEDRRSLSRRRRLFHRLRVLVIAHCRAEAQALCPVLRAARGHLHFVRIAREEHDLGVRLEQLEAIPADHPLWQVHLEELARRLRSHLAGQQQRLHDEACRRLDQPQLEALVARYRQVRQETVELLQHHQHIAWRALLDGRARTTA